MGKPASTFAPVLLPISLFLSASAVSSGSHSSGRQVGEISSHPVYARSERRSPSVGTVATSGMISKGYQVLSELPEWLPATVNRLNSYDGKEAGWKGEGTKAPEHDAIKAAINLVSQFATEMPNLSAPMVSADDDGSICLYWRADPMLATVSVYGDGAYAFYAEGYDDAVRADAALVGEPLSPGLVSAMTGSIVSALVAA